MVCPLGWAPFTIFLCVLLGANAVAIRISLTGPGVFTTAGIHFGLAAVLNYRNKHIKGT